MSDSTPSPDLTTENYDVMLEQLDKAIDEIADKIESGRIRNPEHEKVRIQYYRALGYLVRTKRKVLEDKTLEDLEAEIEELKAARKTGTEV
jgi:Mg2+ and Co2+ transporter CorA